MKKKVILSTLGGLLIAVSCTSLTACNLGPSAQHQYDDQRLDHEQEWHNNTSGFSGSFDCHTKDGGCFHMSCDTKPSCEFMLTAKDKCAVPIGVKDKDCTPKNEWGAGMIIGGNGGGVEILPGTTVNMSSDGMEVRGSDRDGRSK